MSGVAGRPVAASYAWANLRLTSGMLVSLLIWGLADILQGRPGLPPVEWALLDVLGHAAVAVYVALWIWPIWGWQAVAVAGCAAVLIDVDHAVAAGSLLPDRLIGLGARPWSHSLLGVVLSSVVVWRLGGPRLAYAVGIGLFTHVLSDATAWPGVPLLVPVDLNAHVLVPAWTLPVVMGGLSVVGAALSATSARRGTHVHLCTRI